jgi:patatin-like phospholipase/acyl hydrolase
MNQPKTFKILSIDGGGLKGMYSLHLLKVIEEKYCKENETLSDYFDMICGTSTGGIIAIGIANKMKITDIIKIYDDNATKIFPKKYEFNNIYIKSFLSILTFGLSCYYTHDIIYSLFASGVSLLIPSIIDNSIWFLDIIKGYKYNNKAITDIADKHFGSMKMNELHNLVCIPSYELSSGSNRVFKFPHKEGGFERDKNVTVKDAILSTTCAPTYFPVHQIKYGSLANDFLIDGGVWANNPSLVGIIEALNYFVGKDKEYEKYEILSIGNINFNNNKIPNNKYFWNISNISSLIDIIFDSNIKSIDYFCRIISKTNDCIYKRIELKDISHNLSSSFKLDNSDKKILDEYEKYGNADGYNVTTSSNGKSKDMDSFFKDKKTYVTI